MINTILRLIVLSLLIYASYTDIKSRTVSNKIILLIWIFSIPLFNLTSIFQIVFIGIMFVFYKYYNMGAADVKGIIPIILSVTITYFLLPLAITEYIMAKYYKNDVPMYISITIAYVIAILLPIII